MWVRACAANVVMEIFLANVLLLLQVTIVYSYDNMRETSKEKAVSNCEGYQTSGVEEYKQLAILTGGTFVEIDKFDVDEVLGIMDGVQQNEVKRRETKNVHS